MDEIIVCLVSISKLYEQFAFRSTSVSGWLHYHQAYLDNEIYIESVVALSRAKNGYINDDDANAIMSIAKDELTLTLTKGSEWNYA
jgi:hypothetical protein